MEVVDDHDCTESECCPGLIPDETCGHCPCCREAADDWRETYGEDS